MTLITYPTRVHFADHVLEEALHSELESAGCKHVVMITDSEVMASDLADRVHSGVPRRSTVSDLVFNPKDEISSVPRDPMVPCDALIAFGTSRSIELGRKSRNAIATRTGARPQLFAVPGVDGLPGPCTRNIESWRTGLPSVVICDPTVALTATPNESLQSCVLSLVRCVESYLAQAYNPLADGIALEGVNRCVINLPKIGKKTDIALQRELMAAALNAALAQEKGVGPAMTLSGALSKLTNPKDEAAVARLVLPDVMRTCAMNADKLGVLQKILGDSDKPLDQVMLRLLSNLPMPETLAEMGIRYQTLDAAAHASAGKAGLTYDRALQAFEQTFERVVQ